MNTLRWEKGGSLRALQDGDGLLANVIDRYELAFYLADDDVFVTSDVCTHGQARLSQGYLIGELIECPMHQGLFDVRTGAVAGPPCTLDVQSFPAKVIEGVVYVGLPATDSSLGQ